jgi:hypothetical protein
VVQNHLPEWHGDEHGLHGIADRVSNLAATTTTNGLGNDIALGVYAIGSTVYAATTDGLSISTDGGTTFTNYNTNTQSPPYVWGVYADGDTIYAATGGGLGISTTTVEPAGNGGNGVNSGAIGRGGTGGASNGTPGIAGRPGWLIAR